MPVLTACCCWKSLESGSRATAWFTGVTGAINFFIDVWLLVHLHWLDANLEDHEKVNFLPPGILAFVYIELFCNLGLIALAFVLLIGINRQHEGYVFIYGWTWGIGIHRSYQIFLGIYTLAFLGSHRITDIMFLTPEFSTVIIYWFLNTILLIAAIMCVMSFWEELMDEVYGKFRRVKYLTMLANIRNAALQNRTMNTGVNTPRSYYSQSVASTLHMAPSQMSIQGPGRAMPSGNPYTHRKAQAPPEQYAPVPQQQYSQSKPKPQPQQYAQPPQQYGQPPQQYGQQAGPMPQKW